MSRLHSVSRNGILGVDKRVTGNLRKDAEALLEQRAGIGSYNRPDELNFSRFVDQVNGLSKRSLFRNLTNYFFYVGE